MEIQIKNLKPNPYRDLENYPISREKVEALKASIEQTGFWDNLLARQSNGDIQIAYGHHRLVALKEVMKPDDVIDIPVKELPDSVMIQVMANENMDEWKVTASVIDETVRVAKEFLEQHPENIPTLGWENIKCSKESKQIASFLGWNPIRISNSLQRLQLIDEDVVDKEAIKSMPTERHAREFATAMKRDPMPKAKQKEFAKEIADSFEPDSKKDQIPSREIHGRVLQEKWKPEKKDTIEQRKEKERKMKLITMETLLRDILFTTGDLIDELKNMTKLIDEYGDSLIIENKLLRVQVTGNFEIIDRYLTKLLKK